MRAARWLGDALSKTHVSHGFAGPAAAHPTAVLAAPDYRRRRLRAAWGPRYASPAKPFSVSGVGETMVSLEEIGDN